MLKSKASAQSTIYILLNIFLIAALFIGLYNLSLNLSFDRSLSSAKEYFDFCVRNTAVREHILLSLCEIACAGLICTKLFKED